MNTDILKLIKELEKIGKRECTFAYDSGRFVINDLEKWDKFVTKWEKLAGKNK